jgi:uncharacterized pyridoxal phosphate-containing UPF0001 family protein
MYQHIYENIRRILAEIPPEVSIVAAAKTRTPDEIKVAVDAGIHRIGENYIQETATAYNAIGGCVDWHFIGHLQFNKVKRRSNYSTSSRRSTAWNWLKPSTVRQPLRTRSCRC